MLSYIGFIRVTPCFFSSTKLAHSMCEYYIVPHSFHEIRPSTTLYYKACKGHVPEQICNSSLSLSKPQYFFVSETLHEAYCFLQQNCTNTSQSHLVYKACTRHIQLFASNAKLAQKPAPAPLCTTGLHKALTCAQYKVCSKKIDATLCRQNMHIVRSDSIFTRKLTYSTSQYFFVLTSLHTTYPFFSFHYKSCTGSCQ